MDGGAKLGFAANEGGGEVEPDADLDPKALEPSLSSLSLSDWRAADRRKSLNPSCLRLYPPLALYAFRFDHRSGLCGAVGFQYPNCF